MKGWKLVPVEPTEEMAEAMCDAYSANNQMQRDHWLHVPTMWKAALAAAPTPPAQDDEDSAMEAAWQTLKPQLDPSGWTASESFNFRGFFEWGWEARRQYDAPPAQEAEPVGFVGQSTIEGLKAGKRVQNWILPKKKDDPDFCDMDVPLYTHAPSDELRQAAEGAEVALSAFCDGEDWLGTMPGDALKTLRDALEGKS
jgi:hypothetical protein